MSSWGCTGDPLRFTHRPSPQPTTPKVRQRNPKESAEITGRSGIFPPSIKLARANLPRLVAPRSGWNSAQPHPNPIWGLSGSSVNLYVGGNMRLLASMGMALLLLASCGDSNGLGAARTAGELCDEVCGWPDMCFAELGAEIQGDQCVDACVQQVDVVGVDCLRAIANVVSCLGTCDFESLSNDQILACQDEAEAISAACE